MPCQGAQIATQVQIRACAYIELATKGYVGTLGCAFEGYTVHCTITDWLTIWVRHRVVGLLLSWLWRHSDGRFSGLKSVDHWLVCRWQSCSASSEEKLQRHESGQVSISLRASFFLPSFAVVAQPRPSGSACAKLKHALASCMLHVVGANAAQGCTPIDRSSRYRWYRMCAFFRDRTCATRGSELRFGTFGSIRRVCSRAHRILSDFFADSQVLSCLCRFEWRREARARAKA